MTGEVVAYVRPSDDWVSIIKPVADLAVSIASTELVPAKLRNRPDAVAAVILAGREIGLPPMTALRTVFIVDGKPALYAEAMLALVLAAGHEVRYLESTGSVCTVVGKRKGSTSEHQVTWTLDEARRAGLSGQVWNKYPRAMLKHRATAELCRDLFADVLAGLAAVEEVAETEVSQDGPAEPAPPRERVRRKKAAPAVEPAPGSSPAGVAPTPDPMDEAAALVTSELGGHPPETPVAEIPGPITVEPPTEAQMRMMHALFGDLGVSERTDRLDLSSAFVRRDLKTANDLSKAEATVLIDGLTMAKDDPDPRAFLDTVLRDWGLVVNEPLPWPDAETP